MMDGSEGHSGGRRDTSEELPGEVTERSIARTSTGCGDMSRGEKTWGENPQLVFRHHELQVLAGHSGEDVQQTVRNALLTNQREVGVEFGGVFQTTAAVEGQR